MSELQSTPRSGRFTDLAAAAGFATATLVCVALSASVPRIGRILVAAPVVLFFVGYAVLAAAFPESGEDAVWARSLPLGERIVLSVGVSIVATPLIALLVAYSELPFSQGLVIAAVAGTTLAATGAAAAVRYQLPPWRRFAVDPSAGLRRAYAATSDDRVLALGLAASLVFCTAAVGFAVGADTGPEPYTEFTLQTGERGSLAASDYPESLAPGETQPVGLVVANREGHSQAYTVVVRSTPIGEDGTANVTGGGEELARMRVTVTANGTRVVEHRLDGSVVDGPTRVDYLLYKGTPNGTAPGDAYRSVSLRLNATLTTAAGE